MSRVSFMFSVHVVAVKCHDRNLLALSMYSFTHPHRARLVTWHTHNANPLPSSGDDVSLASGQPCGHTFCATWLGTHRGLLFFTAFMYHHSARYMASPPQAASSYLMCRQWLGIDMYNFCTAHYDDVIMCAITSQITSLTIVYSTVYSDADQRKHQSSASLAFVWGIDRGPVNSPHKWPVTRKMFPFDDVIMPLPRCHMGLFLPNTPSLIRHRHHNTLIMRRICGGHMAWLPQRTLLFPQKRRQWPGTDSTLTQRATNAAWLPQRTSCFPSAPSVTWHRDTTHSLYAALRSAHGLAPSGNLLFFKVTSLVWHRHTTHTLCYLWVISISRCGLTCIGIQC